MTTPRRFPRAPRTAYAIPPRDGGETTLVAFTLLAWLLVELFARLSGFR